MKSFYPLARVAFIIFIFAFMMWSCGDGGDVTWEGESHQWKQMTLSTSKNLNDIFVLDATHAWAVGAGGTIISYDGAKWSDPIESNPKTTNDLYAVVAFDADDVWALGHRVRVHFDGNTWSTHTIKEDPNLNHTVKGATVIPKTDGCSNATRYQGWAVTQDSNYYRYDGSDWEYAAYGKQTDRHAISANCEGQIWSVGNHAKIWTWTQANGWVNLTPIPEILIKKPINGVSVCQDGETCNKQGIVKWKHVLAVGRVHLVYHSKNGLLFDKYDSGENDKLLNDVVYLDESNAWAVGNDGTIVFSNNPPNYWEIQTWDTELAEGKPNLFAVAALDAEHAWAVGANGTLLEYKPSQ